MIRENNARTSNRRGAALIIALVLLLLVGAISTSLIRGFYTDRQERNRRVQSLECQQPTHELLSLVGVIIHPGV